jgi:hypothetical protein
MKRQCKKRLEFIFHLAAWILTFALISWLGCFFYRHVERGEFPAWVYVLFAAYALLVAGIELLITRSGRELES